LNESKLKTKGEKSHSKVISLNNNASIKNMPPSFSRNGQKVQTERHKNNISNPSSYTIDNGKHDIKDKSNDYNIPSNSFQNNIIPNQISLPSNDSNLLPKHPLMNCLQESQMKLKSKSTPLMNKKTFHQPNHISNKTNADTTNDNVLGKQSNRDAERNQNPNSSHSGNNMLNMLNTVIASRRKSIMLTTSDDQSDSESDKDSNCFSD
jgi:hypothetical protein